MYMVSKEKGWMCRHLSPVGPGSSAARRSGPAAPRGGSGAGMPESDYYYYYRYHYHCYYYYYYDYY